MLKKSPGILLLAILACGFARGQDDARISGRGDILRVVFLASDARWVPELPRLAALLERDLAARGATPIGRELHAPGLIAILVRSEKRAGARTLRPLLRAPRYRRWPALRLLWSDADTPPTRVVLRATMRFELQRPEDSTRSDADVARALLERHLIQRGASKSQARALLWPAQLELRSTAGAVGAPAHITAELRYREPAPEPRRLAQLLALFAPRPRIELRVLLAPPAAALAELRRAPSDATFKELEMRPALREAGIQLAPHFALHPDPIRLSSDLAMLRGGPPLLSTSDFATLEATSDALGAPALHWRLTPEAAHRVAQLAPEKTDDALAFVVNGAVWSRLAAGSGLGSEGLLCGRFDPGSVIAVAGAFAPLDPPVEWRLETIGTE